MIWILLFGVLLDGPASAQELTPEGAPNKPTVATTVTPIASFRPYVPERRDYRFELGAMWEEDSIYWMSAGVGFHIGRCVFTQSQTCQQYFDILGGVGGREGQTNGMAMADLRWQFVSFPDTTSPYVRLMAGAMNIQDNQRDGNFFSYGIGYGVSISVHERVDLHLEARYGGGDHEWGQAFVATSLKMDKWLDFFATKMKEFGIGTVELTGSVIKGTLKTSGEVMGTVIGRPVQKATQKIFGDKKKDDPKKDQKLLDGGASGGNSPE